MCSMLTRCETRRNPQKGDAGGADRVFSGGGFEVAVGKQVTFTRIRPCARYTPGFCRGHPVNDRFTASVETADLKEAKALLEEPT